eukprot:3323433-Rhodomonas_salina.1
MRSGSVIREKKPQHSPLLDNFVVEATKIKQNAKVGNGTPVPSAASRLAVRQPIDLSDRKRPTSAPAAGRKTVAAARYNNTDGLMLAGAAAKTSSGTPGAARMQNKTGGDSEKTPTGDELLRMLEEASPRKAVGLSPASGAVKNRRYPLLVDEDMPIGHAAMATSSKMAGPGAAPGQPKRPVTSVSGMIPVTKKRSELKLMSAAEQPRVGAKASAMVESERERNGGQSRAAQSKTSSFVPTNRPQSAAVKQASAELGSKARRTSSSPSKPVTAKSTKPAPDLLLVGKQTRPSTAPDGRGGGASNTSQDGSMSGESVRSQSTSSSSVGKVSSALCLRVCSAMLPTQVVCDVRY